MMTKHTPEPWHTVPGANLTLLVTPVSRSESITLERQLGGVLSETDARRIVACVNALRGASTEAIEVAGGLTDDGIRCSALIGILQAVRGDAP